jgi:starch synthase (maltosyl-transferring)
MTFDNWDFRAEWFWDRVALFQRAAPVLMAVEAPFGPRLAAGIADSASVPAALRRAVAAAAGMGDGWLMPIGFDRGVVDRLDPRRGTPEDVAGPALIAAEVAAANTGPMPSPELRPVAAPGLEATAFATGPAGQRRLGVINPNLLRPLPVALEQAAALLGGAPPAPITLEAGGVAVVTLNPARAIRLGRNRAHRAGADRARGG